MIYFISDMHFSHANVIRFSNRPFNDVEEMNEKLIHNWNSVVKDEDTVYHLGDFAFDNEQNISHFMARLRGNINFIQGNHDKTLTKLFLSNTIKSNRLKYLHQYVKLKYENNRFILFHYPIENWDGKYRDSIHIHGHSHFNFGNTMPNRFDVGVEGINYTPISIDEILLQKTTGMYNRPRYEE